MLATHNQFEKKHLIRVCSPPTLAHPVAVQRDVELTRRSGPNCLTNCSRSETTTLDIPLVSCESWWIFNAFVFVRSNAFFHRRQQTRRAPPPPRLHTFLSLTHTFRLFRACKTRSGGDDNNMTIETSTVCHFVFAKTKHIHTSTPMFTCFWHYPGRGRGRHGGSVGDEAKQWRDLVSDHVLE